MLIDTHCHLDFKDFAEERDQIIQRALDAGVKQMITISTRVKKFGEITALAEHYEQVFCSVGVHPNNAHEEPDVTTDELVELSRYPKCVALGPAPLERTDVTERHALEADHIHAAVEEPDQGARQGPDQAVTRRRPLRPGGRARRTQSATRWPSSATAACQPGPPELAWRSAAAASGSP